MYVHGHAVFYTSHNSKFNDSSTYNYFNGGILHLTVSKITTYPKCEFSVLLSSVSFPVVLSPIFPVRLHLLLRLNSSTIPELVSVIHNLNSRVTTTNLYKTTVLLESIYLWHLHWHILYSVY